MREYVSVPGKDGTSGRKIWLLGMVLFAFVVPIPSKYGPTSSFLSTLVDATGVMSERTFWVVTVVLGVVGLVIMVAGNVVAEEKTAEE